MHCVDIVYTVCIIMAAHLLRSNFPPLRMLAKYTHCTCMEMVDVVVMVTVSWTQHSLLVRFPWKSLES